MLFLETSQATLKYGMLTFDVLVVHPEIFVKWPNVFGCQEKALNYSLG